MAAPIFFLSTEAANGGVLIGFSFNKVTEVTNGEHHRRLLSEKMASLEICVLKFLFNKIEGICQMLLCRKFLLKEKCMNNADIRVWIWVWHLELSSFCSYFCFCFILVNNLPQFPLCIVRRCVEFEFNHTPDTNTHLYHSMYAILIIYKHAAYTHANTICPTKLLCYNYPNQFLTCHG